MLPALLLLVVIGLFPVVVKLGVDAVHRIEYRQQNGKTRGRPNVSRVSMS